MKVILAGAAVLLAYLIGIIVGRKSIADESEEYERRIHDLKEEMRTLDCGYAGRVKDLIMEREFLRGQIAEMKQVQDTISGKRTD
ncbi:MAG: hypothetical protein E7576_07115 [Ruminococcaceae bacterium]|nr:hypothetical protein [Oscillospiraceae bacterium]